MLSKRMSGLGCRVTHICVFDQMMDGPLYVKILEDSLLPFLSEAFPDGDYQFMQDNDPKHTSRVVKDFFKEKDIKWWPPPASSEDFNPIERIWAELKHYFSKNSQTHQQKGTRCRHYFFLKRENDS